MTSNQILNTHALHAMEQMKYEIAQEMGIEIGADTPSRLNGKVGGEMVKRMLALAEEVMAQREGR